jgi:hypothetical protein
MATHLNLTEDDFETVNASAKHDDARPQDSKMELS